MVWVSAPVSRRRQKIRGKKDQKNDNTIIQWYEKKAVNKKQIKQILHVEMNEGTAATKAIELHI